MRVKVNVRRTTHASRVVPGFEGDWTQGRVARGVLVLVLSMIAALPAAAQQQVSGRVVSAETLAPLAGVLVSVEDTDVAVLTNADGRYSVSAPGEGALIFSLIGYSQERVAIENRAEVDIALQTSALALDEVVVVGYGSQTRQSVTGSVSQVSAEEIERTSATTTGGALVGKLAGINTRAGYESTQDGGSNPRDGRPGTPPLLEIRNMGEPLFVIDGIPRNAEDFNNLNGADIETVSILKDASASVYGFRAANGVVLVTTKKGSALQRPQFRLDANYGYQYISRPLYPFGYGVTAYQQVYSVLEHEQNLGLPRSRTAEEMQEWLTAPTYETWPELVRPRAPQASINGSLSGGLGNTSFYLSVGHVTQDYVQVDNNFNRTNVQANLRAELFDGFSIGSELSGRIEVDTNIAGSAHSDPVVNLFRAVQSPHSHQPFYANGNPEFLAADVRILQRSPPTMRRDVTGYQDQLRRNATGNFWAEYASPFGLTAKGTFSYRFHSRNLEFQTKSFDAYCYDEVENSYFVCGGFYGPNRRSVRAQDQGSFAQILLNYGAQLGEHSIAATGAYEIDGSEDTVTELESVPPLNSSFLISQNDVIGVDYDWGIQRRASYVGRLNYDYAQKYLIEVLGRYDGSYLYAPEKRWGFFPGVSVGWRISEEPFMQNIGFLDFLDELKLRASWGEAGREQDVDPWDFIGGASFGTGDGAVLDGQVVTGARPRGLAVTNLSWVTSTTRNIGFDFGALNGRLSGEFDVFERVLSGIPASRYDVVLPEEVGYGLPDENLESDGNVGFDFVLRYSDRIGNVRYSLSPNFTVAREKTISRYKPRYGNSYDRYRNREDNRWDNISWTYKVIGQFQSMEEIANHPVNLDGVGNATLLPGDWIYEDVNDDGIIDEFDERPHGWGTGTPILQYGFNASFGYGPFTLAVDLYGGSMFHHTVDNDRRVPFNADHGGAAYWNSRWRRADVFDDNSEWIPGRYPPLRRGDLRHSSYRVSDFYTTNINYLRLSRVELGVTVPTDLADRFGMSQARIYASASNPYVRTFYSQNWASDPENGGNQRYPKSSVINVGISATLGGGPQPAVPIQSADNDNDG